ncbi:TetR/AcrR family transcriptional regulator [uncultured Methylobacterium sp.]|uniref:TetR/AcrR family transcriptional regulator n=1 Tax=uncultured Methylobacterium sp. TaxID=157278 RepID=UPI002595B9CB|nr:TetR/AcrR family transcriptional regulator [uncultured Methylobacterium sp.]
MPEPQDRSGLGPQGARDAVARRIIEAAGDIFLSYGFDAASTEIIAANAGVPHGSLEERFASKAELFKTAAIGLIERRVLPVEERSRAGELPCGDARECLHAVALAVLQVMMTPDILALDRIVTAKATRFPEFARAIHEFCDDRLLPLIENCLREGVRRGELAVPDLRFAAEHFLSAVVCAPLHRAVLGLDRDESSQTKRENLRRSLNLFLSGCERRPA